MKYLLMVFLLIGCQEFPEENTKTAVRGMFVHYDEERNIVCYMIYSNGISCIDLELRK